MAEIGRISLVVAFIITGYLTVASGVGAVRRQADLLASARNAVYVSAVLVSLAWGMLLYAFAAHDFSLLYVARYNSRDTDLAFSLSGAYAGQEGSLLMWAWGISIALLVVTLQYRGRYKGLMPWVTGVMGFISTFFLALLTLYSDPFVRSASVPPDGQGLNPLLENVGMLFHPPALYVGYVAFTVPFAFAVAALMTGKLGSGWLEITRRWALFAWVFLGIGNLLGAQWAYVELGWGGYWGWDPVENSSLMPWLTGTAFLHSSVIQRRRGMLKVWNLVLIIATFTLTIFGTFLTRSDLLSSVHTFGETSVGPMFVAMMAAILGTSMTLLWVRRPLLKGEGELDSLISRESSFLLNNLLLVGGAFAVLWGTIFPLVSEAARGVKITVNASFFNQVVGPILLAVVVLMGLCPLLGWRQLSLGRLAAKLRLPALAALSSLGAALLLGVRQPHALVALASCGFTAGTVALEFLRGARAQGRILGKNPVLALGPLVWRNRPRYGGYLVHLGVVLLALGAVCSMSFKIEKDVTLAPGEEVSIWGYRLAHQGLSTSREGRKETLAAEMKVYSGNQQLGTMSPSKEFYRGFKTPNTEVAIYSTPVEDLYVILNGWSADESVNLKLVINPLVAWIWVGGYVILLGSVIAFWPDRSGPISAGGQGLHV